MEESNVNANTKMQQMKISLNFSELIKYYIFQVAMIEVIFS